MKFNLFSISRMAVVTLLLCTACRSKANDFVPQPESTQDLQYVVVPADLESQIIEYPGYWLSYNNEMHQPNWVAWELTRDEAKSYHISRHKSNFQPDPQADGCAQLWDYRGSGYTRGHMCPAGDMRWDQDAMDATFYLTNITPQVEELNNGTWKKLEEKCRYWAQRDSAIIIVCGPILTDDLDETIGESHVPVPKRFFKVILAPFAKPMRAIGFIMPNGYVPGGLQGAAVSVDEIERITGLDFFAPLPDDIENKIEAECNFPRWSVR